MPERSSKRKARRDSPVNSLDEPESSSMRTENAASLSDRDFTELSEKIEKSVSKRIKDAEVGQREILKMIENLTSKIDTLTERPPNNVRHDPGDEDAENTDYRYRLVEPSDLLPNHGQHRCLPILANREQTYTIVLYLPMVACQNILSHNNQCHNSQCQNIQRDKIANAKIANVT